MKTTPNRIICSCNDNEVDDDDEAATLSEVEHHEDNIEHDYSCNDNDKEVDYDDHDDACSQGVY